jgi:hypothetical protein
VLRKRLEIHAGVSLLKSRAVLKESATHDLQKRTRNRPADRTR